MRTCNVFVVQNHACTDFGETRAYHPCERSHSRAPGPPKRVRWHIARNARALLRRYLCWHRTLRTPTMACRWPCGSAFSHCAHWCRVKIDVMTGTHCRMPHSFPGQSVCPLPGHGGQRRTHRAVRDGRTDAGQRNPGGTPINALWPRKHGDRAPTPPASAQELLAIGADGVAFCADLLGSQSRTNAGSGKRSGEARNGGGRRGGASKAGSVGSVIRIPVNGPTEYTSAIAKTAIACASTSSLAR